MCIRDSEIAVEAPDSSSVEDNQKKGDKDGSSKEAPPQTEKPADGSLSISHEMQGDIPVSYTHLTLPTSDLV